MNDNLQDPTVSSRRHWLGVAGDFALVIACLGLATWLFSFHDPLWLRLNPSPLILVPLLIGGRYGLVAGVVTGLVTSGIGAAVAVERGFGSLGDVIHDHRYLFAGLPVLGLFAGELRSALNRAVADAGRDLNGLKETNARALASLRVAEESAHRLERQLAVHGLEMVSLDNELATILKADDNRLHMEVLQLLYRTTGIQTAAVYVPIRGGSQMRRVASLDEGEGLPESLPLDEEIVERALVSRDLVTCRDLWEGVPKQGNHWMAALPWVDHGGHVRAVLMIRRMSLLSVNWHTFDRMKTVCQWVTCCRLVKTGTHALSDAEASTFKPSWDEELHSLRDTVDENFDRLRETARLCVRSRDMHQLSTVGLCFPRSGALLAASEELLTALSECLRPQDVCAADPDSDRLLVILPMLDLDESGTIVDRLLEVLRGKASNGGEQTVQCWRIQLQATETADAFLSRLRKGER